MELEIGRIYKSPYHGREFKITCIQDLGDAYRLEVIWFESDFGVSELGEINVFKDDVKRWKLVK